MPTIGGSVIGHALRVPEREALVADGRRWTWAQLDDEVARCSGLFLWRGLSKGDRLAVMAPNCAESVIVILAALRLGVIVVPVNARLTAPEVGYILADCGAACVVSTPGTAEVVADAIGDRTIGRIELRPGFANGHARVDEDRATETDDAFIVYTSGTTGAPKGVLLDHHRAIWAGLSQIMSLGMRDGARYLHLSPLHHSGGIVFLTAVTLLGGTHIVADGFEAGTVLEIMEHERVECFLGVPTTIKFLLRHPDIGTRDLSALRIVVFGAAPMPADTIADLLARFPGVNLVQLCGQTEAGPTGLCSTTDQLRSRPDSTGHQGQPFVAVRVVDAQDRDVEVGEVGELLFRGEGVMKGYWGDDPGTAHALRGGWLHTGDLVVRECDGSLRLVDRLKDVIITAGQNVYSAEVEQVVATHPAVSDCAVLGRPHADYGQTVVAVVQLRPGATLTLDELRLHCATRLAQYKIPRDVVNGAVVRNAAGKIQKHRMSLAETRASQ